LVCLIRNLMQDTFSPQTLCQATAQIAPVLAQEHVQDFLNRFQAADSVLDCVGFLLRRRRLHL
ncbi:MAG TPA: hypothetical protein PK971_15440, partial [Saprospiraceae bacterium]|nr:hypothetical protein [Saprospiraceae bacterium]